LKIEIWSRETRSNEAGYAAQLIEALPLNFTQTTIVLEPLVRRIDTIDGTIGTTGAGENEGIGDTVGIGVGPLDGTTDTDRVGYTVGGVVGPHEGIILGFIDMGGRVG
jgi:hypothetical protein